MSPAPTPHRAFALVGFLLTLALPVSAAPRGQTLTRFGLIVGANDGGAGRPVLRHAHADARAMAQVMRELGGLDRRDAVTLLEPSRDALDEAFVHVAALVEEAKGEGARTEFLFYYSGHSDERGLLIGDERVPYTELRDVVQSMRATVTLAILDSCASGTLTRGKGGVRRPPFLIDRSTDLKGYAFLASASADEAAQESDKIGGSFFTHYLVTGLRGAADASGDGRVTLNEAYHHAFHETLSRTETTLAGPQHPQYDIRLAGSGDLVLTDLRGTSALLSIAADLEGRLFLRDADGRLVVELDKRAGRAVTVGLEPGAYRATLERSRGVYRGVVSVADDAQTLLVESLLTRVEGERVAARGGAPSSPDGPSAPAPAPSTTPPGDPAAVEVRPFVLSVVPGLSMNDGAQGEVLNHVALHLFLGMGDHLDGVELSGIGALRAGSVKGIQGAGVFNHAAGPLAGAQVAGVLNSARAPVRGVQGAGTANIALGGLTGAQVSGVVNYAHGVVGVQVAPVTNASLGEVHGLQLSLANVALKGAHGAQLGLANVALERVRGAQIGLVNVAPNADFALGLFNLMWEGRTHLSTWSDELGFVHVGVKHGGDHWHNSYHVGYRIVGDEVVFAWGLGLGAHLPLGERFFMDFDLQSHSLSDGSFDDLDSIHMMPRFSLTFGWRIVPRFALFAGPSLSALISEETDGASLPLGADRLVRDGGEDGVNVRMWPGFVVGLQAF
jgi:hypothetical protein